MLEEYKNKCKSCNKEITDRIMPKIYCSIQCAKRYWKKHYKKTGTPDTDWKRVIDLDDEEIYIIKLLRKEL